MGFTVKKTPEEEAIEKIKKKVATLKDKEKPIPPSLSIADSFEPKNIEKNFDTSFEDVNEKSIGETTGFYKSIEDKWYQLLDKIDETVPIYKLIDPIETVVPSLPLFLVLSVLFFLGLGILLISLGPGFGSIFDPFFPGVFGAEYSFRTVDEEDFPVDLVDVTVISGSAPLNVQSDEFGDFKLVLPQNTASITAQKEGFQDFEGEFTLSTDTTTIIVLIKEIISVVKKNLTIYSGSSLFKGTSNVTFSCSNPNAIAPEKKTTTSGKITGIIVPDNCGSLSFKIIADGYEDFEGQFGTGTGQSVTLTRRQQPTGKILISVIDDETGAPVLDVSIDLFKQSDAFVKTKKTIAGGIVLFQEIAPGDYYISAVQISGYEDIIKSAPIVVEANEKTEITLRLIPFTGEVKKILGKIVDEDTLEPLGNATIRLISGGHLTENPHFSNDTGIFEIANLQEDSYGLYVTRNNYLAKVFDSIGTVSEDGTTPTVLKIKKATSENSGDILVIVKDSADIKEENANVSVESDQFSFPLQGTTDTDGEAAFSNQPPGDYKAIATTGSANGESPTRTLHAGTTLTLNVDLVTAKGTVKVIVKKKNSAETVDNALVKIRNYGSGDLLQQISTNSAGESGDILLDVGQAVFVEVTEVGGDTQYVLPVISSTVTVEENTTKTITIELRTGNIADQTFSIAFEDILDMSDQSATGLLSDSTDYKLEYEMIIPQALVDGSIVIKTGTGNTVSADDVSIFASRPIGVGTYYNCVNTTDNYGTCTPTVNVSQSGSTAKQVIIDSVPSGVLGAGVYSFSVSIKIDDITFTETPKTVPVFFGMRGKTQGSTSFDKFFKSDQTLDSHDLVIGGIIDCVGAACDVFSIETDVTQISDGAQIPNTGTPEVPSYPINLNDTYTLDVRIVNLSQQTQSGLTLKVGGVSSTTYLDFSGHNIYTSPSFNLDPSAEKIETINLNPLQTPITSEVQVDIMLEGTIEDVRDIDVWFTITDIPDVPPPVDPSIILETNPIEVTENIPGQQVAVTARKSTDNTVFQGVQIKMAAAATGVSPSYGGDFRTTLSDGTTTFTIDNTGNTNRQYCFLATHPSFPQIPATEKCIQVVAANTTIPPPGGGFTFPTNIDCVTVTPANGVFFDLDLPEQQKEITITADNCDDNVQLRFAKLDAFGELRVLEQDGTEIIAKNPDPNAHPKIRSVLLPKDGPAQKFKIDISSSQCPKSQEDFVKFKCEGVSCNSLSKICPGEYRVNVVARFETDILFDKEFSNVNNGKVRVFAIPGSIEENYCFELCTNGRDCTFNKDSNPFATFDLASGALEGKIHNKCPPKDLVDDIFSPVLNLSTCPNQACTSSEVRNFFGTLTFSYFARAEVDGETAASDRFDGSIDSASDEVFLNDIDFGKKFDETFGAAYTLFATLEDGESMEGRKVEFIVETKEPPEWIDLGFDPIITLRLEALQPGSNIIAKVTGVDTSQSVDIPFGIDNRAIGTDRAAFLEVYDYINQTSDEVEAKPIQFVFLIDPTPEFDNVWASLQTQVTELENYLQSIGRTFTPIEILTIGGTRGGVSFPDPQHPTVWNNESVGFNPWNSDTGWDFFNQPTNQVGCTEFGFILFIIPVPLCQDAKAEAWGPAILYTLDQIEWQENADKFLLVYANSAPSGSQHNNLESFRWLNGRPYFLAPSYGSNTERSIIQKIEDKLDESDLMRKIKIYFWGDVYLELNNIASYETGSDSINDIVEAVADVVNASNGGILEDPANLVQAVETIVYQKDAQKFHVIFDALEENVCKGHNNLEGVTGKRAIDSLRRDFSWVWKRNSDPTIKLDYCNPLKYDPKGPPSDKANKNFVYCDSLQFQQLILERILEIRREYANPTGANGSQDEDVLNDLQKFSTALIIDGYGIDFLEDFKALGGDTGLFGNVPMNIFDDVEFNYLKYVDAPGRFLYEIDCGTNTGFTCGADQSDKKILPTSGIYDVDLDIKFDLGAFGDFMASSGPTANIKIKLKLKFQMTTYCISCHLMEALELTPREK